jgi:hypothetical protein
MMKLNLKRSTVVKLAIGVVAICLISLLIKWRSSCKCNTQKKVTYGTLKPLQALDVTSIPDPEVRFGEYNPDEEEEDIIMQEVQEVPEDVIETFAEYVPEYRERYVDAKDTFSHPNFPEKLL